MASDATQELLRRHHDGDERALGALLERDLPWIRAQVRRRLGRLLRAEADSMDFVNKAVVDALKGGPRFMIGDQGQFRALMVRIVENVVRSEYRYLKRGRRDIARRERLPTQTVIDLDAGATSPSVAAERSETADFMQLALDLLDPDDRDLIIARQWEGRAFEDIGGELGLGANTARMRFHRALGRLAKLVKRIRQGQVRDALGQQTR